MQKKTKTKKRVSRKSKVKKINSKKKSIIKKNNLQNELIFKTKPEWARSALVNKAKYQKKYSYSIKNNNEFY